VQGLETLQAMCQWRLSGGGRPHHRARQGHPCRAPPSPAQWHEAQLDAHAMPVPLPADRPLRRVRVPHLAAPRSSMAAKLSSCYTAHGQDEQGPASRGSMETSACRGCGRRGLTSTVSAAVCGTTRRNSGKQQCDGQFSCSFFLLHRRACNLLTLQTPVCFASACTLSKPWMASIIFTISKASKSSKSFFIRQSEF
jgi:hypothetical protein